MLATQTYNFLFIMKLQLQLQTERWSRYQTLTVVRTSAQQAMLTPFGERVLS